MIGSNRVGNCCVYFCLSSLFVVTECDGRGDEVTAVVIMATDRIKSRLVCSASREELLHR